MKIDEIIALPGARIQILIREDTPIGQFNDALYYTPTEIDKIADAKEIDAAKQARVDNWIAFVQEQSSKPPVVPTKEELKESAESQAKALETLTTQFIAAAPTKEEAQAVIDSLQKQLDELKAATGQKIEAVGEEVIP